MEVQVMTSRTGLLKQETHAYYWIISGSPASLARASNLNYVRIVYISTLLYGSECWKITEGDPEKLSSFHMKCLRQIAHIFWPKTKSNKHLLMGCNQQEMATVLMQRRWKMDWSSHQKILCHPHQNRTPLDTWGQKKTRKSKDNMEKNSERGN